jgi:two-component system, LytTR family, response regulator
MKIRTVIIDDERNGIGNLEILLERFCADVKVVNTFTDPILALEKLKTLDFELLFLDINMPHISGLDLLDVLGKRNFKVVFTTAHDHYTAKAFRKDVLDYLLKPIDIIELVQSVEKVKKSLQIDVFEKNNLSHDHSKLKIPTRDGFQYVQIDEVVYLKSDSNYTIFILTNGTKVTSSKTLKFYEEQMPNELFCRIHESYIINISKVKRYIKGDGGQVVLSNHDELEVSRKRKVDLLAMLNAN